MEQLAAYIALGGVVLIARPTSLFAHPSPSANSMPDIAPALNATASSSPAHPANDYDQVTPSQRAGAVGIALIGVLGSACAYTTIRWIGRRAHPLLSVNYFAAWCTVVSVVMMLALPEIGFLLPKGLKEWSYLIFLGICGFVMVGFLSFDLLLGVRLVQPRRYHSTYRHYCEAIPPRSRPSIREIISRYERYIYADAIRAVLRQSRVRPYT